MIRASNFPVLLVISLYERQQYRDTTLIEQLGDFAERYVGSLPRRLKAAGASMGSIANDGVADWIAGFENSRRDIGAVFEIEREVGSFYKGWDDDVDIEDAEQPLPVLDLGENEDKADAADMEDNNTSQSILQAGDSNGTAPGPFTSSPGPTDSFRQRRSSMPASPSPRASPAAAVFHPAPAVRQRRNSSIHEPSPLARLFVSPPAEAPPRRMRDRQQTMMQSLSMSSSGSQPLFPGAMSPTRRQHTRTRSILPLGERAARKATHFAKPSVTTIDEGRKVSFRESTTPSIPFPTSPQKTEPKLKSPQRSRSPSIRDAFGMGAEAGLSGSIGKASDVVEELRATLPAVRDPGWGDRLEKIEQAQARIEELLVKLVGSKACPEVFSDDER